MFRRSTNNPWIPVNGLNGGPAFAQIGGEDPSPGSGSRYAGLLGQTVVHSTKSALQDSKLSVGTLFEGVYQLVRVTTALVRGQLLFWDTLANNGLSTFTVTHTVTAASCFRAGVALFTDAAVTPRFCYIQVAGLASMLFGATPAAAADSMVIQATAADTPLLTVATVNTFADATAVPTTVAWHKSRVGYTYGVPTASVTNPVFMDLNGFIPNVG
jgi:hypothetical protein